VSEPIIRSLRASDLDVLVALNEDAAPAVNVVNRDELCGLADQSAAALVVDDGAPAGLLLALAPGIEYPSENYRWFSARAAVAGSDFLYVDRIIVASRLRGTGVGARLYAALFETARKQHRDEVLCEVNLEPPNPGSLRFHERLGFAEVGQQWTKGDTVQVALLARAVP
jgi:uncharacterized protein